MQEVLAAKGQLKITEAIIKELEKSNRSCGEEISRLEEELSMTKIHNSVVGVLLVMLRKRNTR